MALSGRLRLQSIRLLQSLHSQPFCSSSAAKTTSGTTDFFGYEGQSESYRLYRPKYPLSLLQVLNDKIPNQRSKRATAVDIACGTGTLTLTLSKAMNPEAQSNDDFGFGFRHVIGLDSSQTQLDQAIAHSKAHNIQYKLEDIAKGLCMDDDSVDLVTIAQGLHWFDIPALLKQVKRVIKV